MANYGLSIQDVNDVLSTAFAGKAAGQVYENERRFDLVVRLDSLRRTNIDDINNLMISTKSGLINSTFTGGQHRLQIGAAQISREDGKRRIVIRIQCKRSRRCQRCKRYSAKNWIKK